MGGGFNTRNKASGAAMRACAPAIKGQSAATSPGKHGNITTNFKKTKTFGLAFSVTYQTG